MKRSRLAAIDVGTNSIRCIVVEVKDDGSFRVLDDEKATVRLGEGLESSGAISPVAQERACAALLRMAKIIEGYGVDAVEAVATSAVRKAANGTVFVEDMERDAGIRIRVIEGEEEAELATLSALHHFDMQNLHYAMVDLGGGSVEIVTAVGDHIEEIFSLDLGTVFLTERFLRRDPIPDKDLALLRKYVRKTLKKALGSSDGAIQCLIGSGGTMTTMGNMIMAVRRERYGSVHGYDVLRSEVVHLLAMLQRKTTKERRSLPGLSPERADIIVAGVAVVDQVMRFFRTNLLKINERGIREGLILRSLTKHGWVALDAEARDWRASVLRFARSCHVDEVHAEQVKRLALLLFDTLAAPCGLDGRSRDLLEAAALLHDVGYFISYAKHHKHGYHLIRHANLFDFSPREKELVANVARYHRRRLPKRKHEPFAQLSAEDQDLVRKLAGILRLADGLDRRRSRHVEDLRCTLTDRALQVHLRGRGDLSVELYGGQVKGDLFRRAFDRGLVLTCEENVG